MCVLRTRNLGQRFVISKMHISAPVAKAAACSKLVFMLLFLFIDATNLYFLCLFHVLLFCELRHFYVGNHFDGIRELDVYFVCILGVL